MRILLADETNRNSDRNDFFVYGALYFDLDELDRIETRALEIRERFGFQSGDYLKWSHNSAPVRIDRDTHTEAKKEIIQVAHDVGAEFIAVVVSHDLLAHVDEERQFRYAIKDVLSQFNYHLENEVREDGICAVDPVPSNSGTQILEDIFHNGLEFRTRDDINLDRIKMISTVSANASHAASMMDIVLGAFKYCINNPGHDVSAEMFYDVASLTRQFDQGPGLNYRYGVLVRPQNVKNLRYQNDYTRLFDDLDYLLDKSRKREEGEEELDYDDLFSSPDL